MEDFEKKIWGYALRNSIAHDGIPSAGSVVSALFNEGLKKQEVPELMPQIRNIINEIKSKDMEWQEKEFKKFEDKISERETREGLPELLNVPKTGVIMRFAPSASGPMHIGHAITASLSFLYVQKYGGKFYFRVEDTNPENIYKPAYKMLEQEAKWLFENKAEIVIQSDNMKRYYDYAEKLIKKNVSYVCICSGDKFREFAERKKECPCRNNEQKENLARWNKMLDKKGFSSGEAVLRFKSNMQNPNPAMRDFPLARINENPHPRQKNKYRIWPLMNLAVAVDDIEMNMTHIIRGKDHRDNAERQKMIYEALGLKKKIPWTGFLGKIHFKELELSTTKFRNGIESGEYSGWDDLKLPTIASLKKQGYKPEAFWKLAEHIGLNEVDKVIEKKEFFKLLDGFSKS